MDIAANPAMTLARMSVMPQPGRANTAPAAAAQGNKENPRAWAVAQDFEALFITSMLENMGRDVQNGEGFFGGGQGEAMFRSLMNDEYGKQIAAKGGIGIADSVYRFILKTQEV